MKTFRLIHDPTRAESITLDIPFKSGLHRPPRNGLYVAAVSVNEYRPPKAGEWYLSGATVLAAWRGPPNDPTRSYQIARLVVINRETKVTDTIRK